MAPFEDADIAVGGVRGSEGACGEHPICEALKHCHLQGRICLLIPHSATLRFSVLLMSL